MPITAPVLGGATLPHVSEYTEREAFRGGASVMVNGAVRFDLVTVAAKRTFVLKFRGLTAAQKTAVRNAYNAVKDTPTSFTPPTDGTPTATNVTWSDESYLLEWEATSVNAGTRILWETTMTLREV